MLLLFFTVSSWAQKDIPVYKIGILANRGKEAGLRRWNDTAHVLSKKIPDARFEIAPLLFEEMDAAVRDQKVDFFIANSAYYAKYEILYRAQAIATIRSKVDASVSTTFGGVIFVKADRQDIQSIQDLKNKRVAAVHDRSFGGWITSLREIREAGLNENTDFKELIQCNLQDKVVEAVFQGKVDVGIVRTGIIESYVTKHGISQNDFRSLNNHRSAQNNFDYSTKLYPEWPFARLAHVDLKLADHVTQVLLSITPNESAAINGEYDSWTVPLNYQEVHECLKVLRIDPYQNYGKVSLKSLFENYKYWILCILFLFFLLIFFSLSLIISNRKLAQSRKEIGKLISRSSSILNYAGEGILGLDLNGCHTFINKAALDMLGYNEEDVLGKPSHSLWHHLRVDGSSYPPSECPICSGTMRKGDIVRCSGEVFWKANGTFFPVEYVSNPILENENVIGVVVIFTDISERLKKESRLQEMLRISEIAQEELQYALEILSKKQVEVAATNLQLQEVVRVSTIMQKMDEALVKVGSYLLSASNTPKALQNAVECLLEAANVSRVYICENFSDPEKGICAHQTHEASADGIIPLIQNPFSQHFSYSKGFSRWQKAFSRGDAIWGNVIELPQEESEILQKQGIESFMAIPIFVGGEWYGFIGFDQHIQTREWKNENFQLLHTAANMIGAYLYKNKVDGQMRLLSSP